jgi:molecular chaperone Hsp33
MPARDDLVRPFQLESGPIRGRLARLGATADEIITQHGYPPAIATLLGEALALTAALSSALKFEGIFTLQARGDGPCRMLVADLATPGRMRGYAQFDADAVAAGTGIEDGRASVPRLLGGGYLAFTVDQGLNDRYQGVVALTGHSLADCAHHYFRESEQIPAAIHVAAGRAGADGAWRAGALVLQRLPEGDPALLARGAEFAREESDDAWHRAVTFLATARREELLDPDLDGDDLLFRLFHEEGVRVFEPTPLAFGCRCSPERAVKVLRSLSRAELEEFADDDRIEVRCEFCNRPYFYTLDELASA